MNIHIIQIFSKNYETLVNNRSLNFLCSVLVIRLWNIRYRLSMSSPFFPLLCRGVINHSLTERSKKSSWAARRKDFWLDAWKSSCYNPDNIFYQSIFNAVIRLFVKTGLFRKATVRAWYLNARWINWINMIFCVPAPGYFEIETIALKENPQ